MPIKVITCGRTDLENYFEKSGIREYKKLSRTPLLVFDVKKDTVKIEIIERADQLLNFSDDTKVMGQWRGEWSSDFFHFTVSQFRKHIEKFPRKSSQFI